MLTGTASGVALGKYVHGGKLTQTCTVRLSLRNDLFENILYYMSVSSSPECFVTVSSDATNTHFHNAACSPRITDASIRMVNSITAQ